MPGLYNIVTADGKLLYTSVWLSLSPLNSSWSELSREECLSLSWDAACGILEIPGSRLYSFNAHNAI